MPFLTMRLVAEERREGTLELLLTMPVTDWQVVLGKFLAALGLMAVLLLLTMPFPITVSFLGPLDKGATVAAYFGALLMAGAFVAIGIMASAFTRNQIVAALVAFFIGFALYLLGALISVLPPSAGAGRGGAVDRLALQEHRARGHRHARRPLLRVDDLRLPARRADDARQPEVALMATAPSKAKTGANAIVFVVLVILGVVAVNLIAARFASASI